MAMSTNHGGRSLTSSSATRRRTAALVVLGLLLLTLRPLLAAVESHTIWDPATQPGSSGVLFQDPDPVELGVAFTSDADGSITALRFYKDAQMTGTHVGHLWTADGTQLAEATFTETESGWQEVALANPVPITANTTYIASYSTPMWYVATTNWPYPSDNPPLHAARGGFLYGPSGSFPSTPSSANYWADVVLQTTPPDTAPPAISSVAATPGVDSATVTWTTDEPANSQVKYGTAADSLTSSASNPDLVTSHSVKLTGLASNTTYYYTVASTDGGGNTSTSAPASFKTQPNIVTSAPSKVTPVVGKISGDHTKLAADDNQYLQISSSNVLQSGATTEWYGTFSGVSNSLKGLTVAYKGKNSPTCNQIVSMKRWTDNKWVDLDSRLVGNSEVQITKSPGGTLADYVSGSSGDGDLQVRVRCSATLALSTSGFKAYGDLMKIVYEK